MNDRLATRPGALSTEQMAQQFLTYPDYRTKAQAPAVHFAKAATELWGGVLTPLMAARETSGRFAAAELECPPTACTGSLQLAAGAASKAWLNPEAIENIVCVEGQIVVRFGLELGAELVLDTFDMVSVPQGVRHSVTNRSGIPARAVMVLSIEPTGSFDALFDASIAGMFSAEAAAGLGVKFGDASGVSIKSEQLQARNTKFVNLVPYKKDLNRTGGLSPEATAALSAGNVYPLIVPQGHVGRSRTAPMYGNQGLYISIAECSAGNDGPPAHAHSDTQETFYVLNGTFEFSTGFDNECAVQAKPGDIATIPKNLMRTFRNTGDGAARLLVIIQGPDRMDDTVSYSRKLGADFLGRFGPAAIEEYAKIKMTFDAEERLGF